jgi:predicted nucleic acid-binding protein
VPYLLDTNVLSELVRPGSDHGVKAWIRAHSQLDLYTSVLVLGEISRGVQQLAPGRRRIELQQWLTNDLPRQFEYRVLGVDLPIALEWGRLTAAGRAIGRELKVVDGLLLATASVRKLTIATRNVHDFEGRGVPVVNPWSGPGT